MKLFEQLTQSATLITPNRRLSATLLKKYHEFQLLAGKTCWPTLDSLPFTSWIERLWRIYTAQQIKPLPSVLTHGEEDALWEDILQKSPMNEALLQLSATADLAKSAWGILKQWQVNLSHPLLDTTNDSTAFKAWANEFQARCHENDWLDTISLTDTISDLIEKKCIQLPSQLFVIGFTELSPQQKQLFMHCEKSGTVVQIVEQLNKITVSRINRVSINDEETEMINMARWANAIIKKEPEANIGCVIPHLESLRERVLQTFTKVLDGENELFNLSAGKNLTAYPIIHTALKCLDLNKPALSLDMFSPLLRSPFLGDAEKERIRRANFDIYLRNTNTVHFSMNALLNSHKKYTIKTACPHFSKRIEQFQIELSKINKTQNLSEWANTFMELLTILGWPGERSLNSEEYQIVRRWLDLMHEYRSLDTVLSPQNYKSALHYLSRMTNKTIFQPQSTQAPIQILGMLEAAEIPFDYCWVMGLDDTRWPEPARPNPFIPKELQKTLHMPHANAERELVYSTRLTEQFQRNAKHIIFSHALKNGDCELRPSALILHVDEITLSDITMSNYITSAKIIFDSRKLETLHDEKAPSILPHEEIRGGVSLLKYQAACPFKAFAEMRLYARPLESPTMGLRAKDRGTIVHKALELIWLQLKDSETLNRMEDAALLLVLEECIQKAIHLVTQETNGQRQYFHLESERLKQMLWNWLLVEKTRPPFKVTSSELIKEALIGPLLIRLRIDRIDELQDGSHLIIDYKTGKDNEIKYWFGERPDELQLPLYCITHNANVAGIAFAEIHANALLFKGISQIDQNIDSIKPIYEIHYAENNNWDQQIEIWKNTLEKIANDFYDGHASIDPKHTIKTCEYCQLKPLCRIHEITDLEKNA